MKHRLFVFLFLGVLLVFMPLGRAAAGTITGTVTDEAGDPIEDMYVIASDTLPYGAVTDENGEYAIENLPEGEYMVYSGNDNNGYVLEYYDDALTYQYAALVQVSAIGIVPDIDFSLRMGGRITGRITDAATGDPAAGVQVSARGAVTQVLMAAITDERGVYTITGLPADSYQVYSFSEFYLRGYYVDEPGGGPGNMNSGTPVAVVEGETVSGIDISLMQGGRISGKVTDRTGAPVINVLVCVYDNESAPNRGHAWTGPDGAYTTSLLAPGTYRVKLEESSLSDKGCYIPNPYYRDAPDFDSAELIRITPSATVTGIDFIVEKAGQISGMLMDDEGGPVENCAVEAYDAVTGDFAGRSSYAYPLPSPGGIYTISLPPGEYVLMARPVDSSFFIGEYYNDVQDFDDAGTITVTDEGLVSGIDFVLAEGGAIAGLLQPDNPEDVLYWNMHAYDYSSGAFVKSSWGSGSTYSINGLPAGSYRVQFTSSAPNYVNEFYNDTWDYAAAVPVPVVAGETTSGIDFFPTLGGSITGTVRDPSGESIGHMPVFACDPDSGKRLFCIYIDEDGEFALQRLPEGDYLVAVEAGGSGCFYWNHAGGAWDRSSADPVTVTKNNITSGVDIVMTLQEEPDSDNDGVPDQADRCPDTPAGQAVNASGCSASQRDSDNDGVTDNVDRCPATPAGEIVNANGCSTSQQNADNDGDGVVNDTDLCPDTPAGQSVNTNGCSESQRDSDGDGVKDDVDVADNDSTVWSRPDKPALTGPVQGDHNVSLTPTLESTPFSDVDGGTQKESEWLISDNDTDGADVMKLISGAYLTSCPVTSLILDQNTNYSARVRYTDGHGFTSDWSDPVPFKTGNDYSDMNGNGVPDSQEVSPELDIDGDGVKDVLQADILCVNSVAGPDRIGLKRSGGCTGILSLRSVNPADITEMVRRPEQIPFGLIGFKVGVDTPGGEAQVIVYLTDPAPADMQWFTYDGLYGWRQYLHAVFSEDRKSVTLTLRDGDPAFGDIDGVANGIIVDPSGIGTAPIAVTPDQPAAETQPAVTPESSGDTGASGDTASEIADSGGGGGGGCFISAAQNGQTHAASGLALILIAFCALRALRPDLKS